jgi:toxin YxiD
VSGRKHTGASRGLCAALWLTSLLHLCACGQAPAPAQAPSAAEEPARSRPDASSAAGSRHDLERDEERGGHTLERHVGRTDEELRERLRRERNISAASTWTDRETAETTVGEALRAERGRIDSWMRRGFPRANLALHYDAGTTIGRTLRRGEEQPLDSTRAVIVLRADGPDSFYVLTAYPEDRE